MLKLVAFFALLRILFCEMICNFATLFKVQTMYSNTMMHYDGSLPDNKSKKTIDIIMLLGPPEVLTVL